MNLFDRSSQAILFCALSVGVPLLAPRALALPTTNPLPGITGLGIIPTTDTVPAGTPEVSLSYEHVEPKDSGHVELPVANVLFGFNRGEVGATYVREHSNLDGFSSRDSYYAVQGKFLAYERNHAALAIGAHYFDFGSEGGDDLGSVLSGYATASYSFEPRGGAGTAATGTAGPMEQPMARVHGGLLVQRVRGGGDSDTVFRPFLGADYFFTPQASLAADYLFSDHDAVRAYSLALRYTPSNLPVSAQIGAGQIDRDTKYFVSASYRFGRGASRQAAQTTAPVKAPVTSGATSGATSPAMQGVRP